MACWNERGCDAAMQEYCPHALGNDFCPPDCKFTACTRPTHKVAVGLEILSYPETDRTAAVKEVCRSCMFYLEHGPKVGEGKGL